MRAIIHYLSLITLLSAWCSISIGSDYFNRITMASDGRVIKFSHMPVSIYVAATRVPEELRQDYMADVQYALDQWAGCSEGQLEFQQIGSEDAHIRVYWTDQPLSLEADPLGEASLVRYDSGEFHVEISILLMESPSSATSTRRKLRAVLLHELGHAIGLWGHSQYPADIMYRKSSAVQPTRRDKNTLLKLLATPANSSFHKEAIAQLKSDISRTPDASRLHFWLGTVYADRGDDDLAIKELLIALKLTPNLMRASHRLGRIFQKEGMYEKAIAYYSREAEMEPSSGLYGIIGMIHLREGKHDRAIESFEKALRIDSEFAEAKTDTLAAYHLWASELIKTKQIDKAVSVLSQAMKRFPSSRVLCYDMAAAYDTGGQYEKAIEQYKKVLEIEPSFVSAKSNIANCINSLAAKQIQNENWEGSIELCKQALEWDSDFWEARKNLESATLGLGKEKHRSGLLNEAISHYRAVLDMNPENLNAYSGLGFALYEKGMHEEAQAQFQAALDIDPDSHDARAGMSAVRRQANVNIAKIAIILTCISMILCIFMIALSRYRHRGGQKSP